MKTTLARSALVCILIASIGGTVFAQSSTQSRSSNQFLTNADATATAKSNDKLKSAVAKMVADTKAGRPGPPASSAFPQAQRNNLSKTAKIAIVAGVLLVIVAVIIVHEARQFH
jgi:hypothetical protein